MPELQNSSAIEFASVDSLAFINEAPNLGAAIKQEFVDFRVDEELGFAFTEEGEHVCILVKKTDLSTSEVVKRLSEISGARKSSVGYAGLKDRRGECTQWFSLPLPEQEEDCLKNFENQALQILETHRNSRKIRIGSHKSNRFQIRLREIFGSKSDFNSRLERIKREGVPNYFGSQRFGWQMGNLVQAQELMAYELNSQSVDSKQADKPVDSLSTIPKKRFKKGMLYSAARSYLFNQLLSHRLENASWNRYLPGDVLNLDGTNRCFVLDNGAEWDEHLQQRLESFDIHITGVLPGLIEMKDKYVSYGESADIENAVCKQYDTLLRGLAICGVKASRRAFRFLPSNLDWHWIQADIDGNNKKENINEDLILEFSLPKGAYATSLLRELCTTI